MSIAFVTGATGYTGRGVVKALGERGVDTYAHVRPDSSQLDFWRGRLEGHGALVDSTAWEAEAMRATLGRLRPTLVFSLLGTTRERGAAARKSGGGEESYQTVDYGLSALLIDAVGAAAPSARLIYLSAMGAGPKARTDYYRARWRVEEKLATSGLEYLVARAGIITGPDRDQLRRGEQMAGTLLVRALGTIDRLARSDLSARFGPMTGDELGRALVELALRPEHGNRIAKVAELQQAAVSL